MLYFIFKIPYVCMLLSPVVVNRKTFDFYFKNCPYKKKKGIKNICSSSNAKPYEIMLDRLWEFEGVSAEESACGRDVQVLPMGSLSTSVSVLSFALLLPLFNSHQLSSISCAFKREVSISICCWILVHVCCYLCLCHFKLSNFRYWRTVYSCPILQSYILASKSLSSF